MTTGTEALVRRAYHFAEGDVPDARKADESGGNP